MNPHNHVLAAQDCHAIQRDTETVADNLSRRTAYRHDGLSLVQPVSNGPEICQEHRYINSCALQPAVKNKD